MGVVGTVAGLWRYPVKSMRGEEMDEIFVGFGGVYGDRLYAFESPANNRGFPFFTGRDQRQILRYRPRWRHPEKSIRPANQAEAEARSHMLNQIPATHEELMLDVETPDGRTLAIDDPALRESLQTGLPDNPPLRLLRSDKALTDCRPVSLFSLQTAQQLAQETGGEVDPRRFRPNVLLDLASGEGFGEDRFVGHNLRLGPKVVIHVLARDGRCMMIAIHPDTAEKTPALLKTVAQSHENNAGVYAAVLMEGMVRAGDPVELLD